MLTCAAVASSEASAAPPAAAPTAPVNVVSPNESVVSACAPLIVLSKAMAPAVELSSAVSVRTTGLS